MNFKNKLYSVLIGLALLMPLTLIHAQTPNNEIAEPKLNKEKKTEPEHISKLEKEGNQDQKIEESITDEELLKQLKKKAKDEDGYQDKDQKENEQEQENGEVLGIQYPSLEAKIDSDYEVLVNTESFFSSSASIIPANTYNVSYFWDLGDGTIKQGKEISHIYKNIGEYKVVLTISCSLGTAEDEIKVQVKKEAVFLIINTNISKEVLTDLKAKMAKYDFLIYTLSVEETGQNFIVEDSLANSLLERSLEIRRSKIIITWTKGMAGVNALLRLGQQAQSLGDFSSRGLAVVTDSNLRLGAKRAQPLYNILQPQYLLLISPELIEQVMDGVASDYVISNVQQSGKDFRLLGIHSSRDLAQLTFYNFMSYFINALINRGVSINTVFLILMLPLVATLFAAARQVLGIKTFGIYIPSILTLTFLAVGLKVGLCILIVILLIGTLVRLGLKKLRLLYLPRVAIVFTAVSLALLVLMAFSVSFNILNLISVSIFPVLILIVLVEEFVKVQMEEGSRNAIILTVETLFLSILCYYFVNWQFMRNLILSYPELIFGTILLNFALGKWTGLRVMEYYRFRKVIAMISREKEKGEEEKSE